LAHRQRFGQLQMPAQLIHLHLLSHAIEFCIRSALSLSARTEGTIDSAPWSTVKQKL
jgi:hypothetical protein